MAIPDTASIKLEVKNLYKVFGDRPQQALALVDEGIDKDEIFTRTGQTIGVKDVSLSIREGEIFVIMGLSGSGKSTLVRLLNRLIEPTRGQVLVDGEDIAAINQKQLRDVRRKKISMVFQSFALMPHINVLDNAAFGLELLGVDVDERRLKAQAALEQVGLSAHGRSYPDELSGGMQQRVGLARALANDPDIMLMDEAFSALDPLIRTEMQDELVKLQADHSRTIVFISHDLDEAMRIGDRIAIMQNGEVVQVGTPNDILQNPANEYVKSFFKGVDISNVYAAHNLAEVVPESTIDSAGSVADAMQQLTDSGMEYGYVVDSEQQLVGVTSLSELDKEKPGTMLEQCVFSTDDEATPLEAETPVRELISTVAQSDYPVPVVKDGEYIGNITKTCLLETLDREAEDDEDDAGNKPS
ncbi:glycine betaine/L-proline ABC transporter ATP-binding protein ProV [Oceanobacter sp. 4_MG-2023]|uniref:glycine betaine/L-proline ABC transporter ATP-binding protein ProV n=1 Tax=Oceanobacter sp. 4_MG-2023 TaxID=3062623 RepID=UPI002735C1CF|nr:glycine betaine/L-proline ABC transporter ATP-binding protein ProV [Oceanobacter sp. 4_MG-2023]MDP2546774.1 glycine betaine/L-proline ABC transporter ATP-binding protein ProV [Oceanobacter sp. 4_MG-2023]